MKKLIKKKLKKQAAAAKKRLKIRQNVVNDLATEESMEEDTEVHQK